MWLYMSLSPTSVVKGQRYECTICLTQKLPSSVFAEMEICLNPKRAVFTTGDTVTGEVVLHQTTSCQLSGIAISLIGLTVPTMNLGR